MPRPAWMRIGTRASRAQAKIASAAGRPNWNAWARGVELDAARTAAQAALGLPDRVLGRVEAAVRHQPAAALGRPLQHAVGRPAVAGMAVGVVERERAGARRGRDLVERGEQRLGLQ